jgi:hypothetical protein
MASAPTHAQRAQHQHPHHAPERRFPFGRILLAIGIVLLATVTFSISSCSRKRPLPEGQQTLIGILRPAELSRVRLGTHTFEQNGRVVLFAESSEINLRDFEGGEVTLRGEIKPNTDRKALPVLIVSEAAAKDPRLHPWKVAALRLAVDVPEDWMGRNFGTGAIFQMRGVSRPVLTLARTRLKELPDGRSILIGGTGNGRLVGESGLGEQRLYVQRDNEIFLLIFKPPTDVPYVSGYFERIARSITFQEKAANSGATIPVRTGTGSAAATGAPCGGAAGFLCPSGQYCEITDQENNIGVCRTIR